MTIESSGGELILKALSASGEARYVGGCVRDHLIGKEFSDIDIATTHHPEQVMRILSEQNIKTMPTGLSHGTVMAIISAVPYEITTLRKDVACDGRHAEVEFTDDFKADAARRDFTMNAMYMSADGKVYDFFDGQQDIKNKIIRFVGEPAERIQEDYLRILRMFRFHSFYGVGDILSQQLEACRENKSGLANLSGERIQMEMMKLLQSENVFQVLKQMATYEILQEIIDSDQVIDTNIFDFAEEFLNSVKQALPPVAIIALIVQAAESHSVQVADKWKLSNRQSAQLELYEEQMQLNLSLSTKMVKKLIYKFGNENALDIILLLVVKSQQRTDVKELLELSENWQCPKFPISGRDVIELGVPHGEKVGELLRQAEEHWIESDYSFDGDELVDFIKGLL